MSLRTVPAMIATVAALLAACLCAARAQVPDGWRLHRGGQLLRDAEHPFGRQSRGGSSLSRGGLTTIGRNASPGSHYLIHVPGAEPERRLGRVRCGRVEDDSQSAEAPRPSSPAKPATGRGGIDRYVLAANWQPAFCETRPSVRECRGGGGVGRRLLAPRSSGPSRGDASIAAFPTTCAERTSGRMAPPAGLLRVGTHAPSAGEGDARRPGSRSARMVGARHLLQGRRRRVLHARGPAPGRAEPIAGAAGCSRRRSARR